MRCPACGGENPDGKRFCRNCAAPLTSVCSACGAQLEPDDPLLRLVEGTTCA
jgi:predicted amidophosphoribosyltransferase